MPAASHRPVGLIAMSKTRPAGQAKARRREPVRASQSQISAWTRSSSPRGVLAVTSRRPSGRKARRATGPRWPRRTRAGCGRAGSQTLIVRSEPPEAIRSPSGRTETQATASVCPRRIGPLLAGRGVPDADGPVVARRRDPIPARAERQPADPVAMPACREERPSRGGVPDPDGPVAADAGEDAAVGAERDARDGAVVAREGADLAAGREVPDLDLARPPLERVVRPPGAAGRGELPAVGAEGDAQDVLGVPAEAARPRARSPRPRASRRRRATRPARTRQRDTPTRWPAGRRRANRRCCTGNAPASGWCARAPPCRRPRSGRCRRRPRWPGRGRRGGRPGPGRAPSGLPGGAARGRSPHPRSGRRRRGRPRPGGGRPGCRPP